MLSSYSTQTLSILLAEFPDFRDSVNLQEDYFSIELNSPSGLPFIISSENDELTVYFSEHHCHFTSFNEQGSVGSYPLDDVADAIDYIRKLISGEVALAVWTKDGTLSMSSTYEVKDGPLPAGRNWFSSWLWRRWMRKREVETRKWSS
ncbi:hypothetical protein [Hymenobacter metallilatus]|uniref:Uncharacterized protein n=1 Tax=Hymenobacter metallilatus TaxID=2493666 RepID=A0A3R9NSJ8_9BACT|nr:hypothetical protein [Hymenobacter metallilatus]RSK36277.1 hypothetical protein EI290_05175 [Hymenobacter metallilatus]